MHKRCKDVSENSEPQGLAKKEVRFRLGHKGITKQMRAYFFRHPNSSAKQCCRDLQIEHKKYAQMCYSTKSEVRQALGLVRSERGCLSRLFHRVEWRAVLPESVVGVVWVEACKRCLERGEVPPFGEWYVVANRNRMMKFTNEFVDVRVFPKSGTCRVLERQPLDWYRVRVYFESALFRAVPDWRVCEALSYTLQFPTRSRVFTVGEKVPPFKIDYYRRSLGLTVKADGSHPDHIEVDESYPGWVEHQLEVVSRFTDQIAVHLDVLKGIKEATKELVPAVRELRVLLRNLFKEEKP